MVLSLWVSISYRHYDIVPLAIVCFFPSYLNAYTYMYSYSYISFLQFDDDKDGSEITKGGEISVPEVFQWQTMKIENEGNNISLCCRSSFFSPNLSS